MLTNPGKTALTGSYIKRQQKEAQHKAWLTLLAAMAAQVLAIYSGDSESVQADQVHEMYNLMAEHRIDYPESESNTRALQVLLQLMIQAKSLGITAERLADWLNAQATGRNLKLPERKQRTQLDAMVTYLAATAREQGISPCRLCGWNRCPPTCFCSSWTAGRTTALPMAAGRCRNAAGN